MTRVFIRAILLTVAVSSAPVAFAQTVGGTSGSITGRVTDASGAIMPGVTVTISSSSMQGLRTSVSAPDGTYQFFAVPPGDYRVSFELGGFDTLVHEGVRVSLGFTATINVVMKVASVLETVTVSGASPVVDVTSTTTTMTFDSERLAALPNARDFWALLAVTPSMQVNRIDVGGSTAGSQTGYSAYDTKSDQHRPLVEGLVMTEGTSGAGMFYDYGAVDEASIGTAGNSAEMPTPGVLSQFVFKSGGNTYHGRLYVDNEWEDLQSHNIPNSATRLCPLGNVRVRRARRPEQKSGSLRPECRHRRVHQERHAVVVLVGPASKIPAAEAEPRDPQRWKHDAKPDGEGDLRGEPQ